ncbi:hypothetical protein KR054_009571, partial [Drosophila jambulina]
FPPTRTAPSSPPPARAQRQPASRSSQPTPMSISGSPPRSRPANESQRPEASAPSPSVAAWYRQKTVPILPTAALVLDTGSKTFTTTAMIDPCMAQSSIDRTLASAFRLPFTRMGDDEVCSATVRSRTGNFQLEVVLKLDPSLQIRSER